MDENGLVEQLKERLPTFVEVMRAVGGYLQGAFRATRRVTYKDARNVVTDVDRVAEGLIAGPLEELFPDDSIYGEERGLTVRDPRRVWVIDGLDGTTNFVTGIPLFASQFAYMADGRILAAVVYVPGTDECFTALAGEGAWRNGEPMQVAEPPDGNVKKAMAILSRAARDAEVERHATIYPAIVRAVRTVRVVNSAAGDVVRVAAGGAHASINNGANLYDILPGILLVQEAGGRATDFRGAPLVFPPTTSEVELRALFERRVDALLAPPNVHAALLEALRPFAP